MKRSRAEPAPSKGPAKIQRRYKDPTPKRTERTRAAPPEKSRKGVGADKNSAATTAVHSSVPLALGPALAPEADQERPLVWDELEGRWWWGAEEEMLLGWFPFVEEDFICSENMGGSGLFWEEENHDIWELQHIQEVPNQAK